MPVEELIVWGNGTTRTVRVLWMLEELDLDYQHHRIGSRTGETQQEAYRALNPKEKIPTLVHGDFVLSESPAIVNYLAQTFMPPADFFIPQNAHEQAKLNEWSYFAICELDANSLYLLRRHEDLPHIYGEAPVANASAREYFSKQAKAVAAQVEAAGHYLMGEKFSTADILMMSCLYWAKLYNIGLPKELENYHSRVAQRETYQKVMRINYPAWFAADGAIPKQLRASLS